MCFSSATRKQLGSRVLLLQFRKQPLQLLSKWGHGAIKWRLGKRKQHHNVQQFNLLGSSFSTSPCSTTITAPPQQHRQMLCSSSGGGGKSSRKCLSLPLLTRMINPIHQYHSFRRSSRPYCSVGGVVGGGGRVVVVEGGSKEEDYKEKGEHEVVEEKEEDEELESLLQTMAAALHKKVLHYQGKIANIQKQLKAAEGSEIYLRKGDALSHNRHLYKKRMERIAVPDWTQINSDGEATTLEIELDPEKGCTANAELFYKKYRKGKRALERLDPIMRTAEKELEALQQYQSFLQEKGAILTDLKERGGENNISDQERLAALASVPATRQLLQDLYSKLIREKILDPSCHIAATAQKAAPTSSLEAAASPSSSSSSSFQKNMNRNQAAKNKSKKQLLKASSLKDIDKYISPSGFTVLAGRSASANERISFQLTKRNQVWFHVRNLPGSHVLIRADFDKVDMVDIEFAARIAAWHSHGKDETRVEVSYCKGSQVRNPPARHKKLGAVSIAGQEQVITVVPGLPKQ